MSKPACQMTVALLRGRMAAPQLLPPAVVAVCEPVEDVATAEPCCCETVGCMFCAAALRKCGKVDSGDCDDSCSSSGCSVVDDGGGGDDCGEACCEMHAVDASNVLAAVAEFMPDDCVEMVPPFAGCCL